jgi:3-oxoacyl-(acyl-carrier-protein) synthase
LADNNYWCENSPDQELLSIIGTIPKRWGRMDHISRIAVVEIGRILCDAGLLEENWQLSSKKRVGLVVGTERGSLSTDLAFCRDLRQEEATASPLLFSYTLANIPLAEAASHYQITGPVYSMYSETPFASALAEAKRWLNCDKNMSLMIAGVLDVYPLDEQKKPNCKITSDFTIIH